MQMNKTFNVALSLVAASALFFGSCKPKENKGPSEEDLMLDTATSEAQTKLGALSVNMPPLTEITKELASAGYKFNKGVLNASGKASSYSSNIKAALGVGAYGADMGYAAAYGQNQDVTEYLKAISTTGDKLGITKVFDSETISQFQANVGKKDSLNGLINGAFDKVDKYLRFNKRMGTSAVIAAGGWIEGLYIATQVVNTERDNSTDKVYSRIWNHLYAFGYLFELLESCKKDADCAKVYEEIQPLREIYVQYGKNAKIGKAELDNIREKVAAVRNQMMN